MTYEYSCLVCKHLFEIEQPITAAALDECPNCKTCALKRLVSGGAGFVLQGDCWYKDGYSKKADS